MRLLDQLRSQQCDRGGVEMHPMPEQPVKWLLRSIKDYLTEDQHKELMVGFDRIKRIYDITSRLRQAQATLKSFHRAQKTYVPDTEQWCHYAIRIQGKQARIERLEEKLKELENTP